MVYETFGKLTTPERSPGLTTVNWSRDYLFVWLFPEPAGPVMVVSMDLCSWGTKTQA